MYNKSPPPVSGSEISGRRKRKSVNNYPRPGPHKSMGKRMRESSGQWLTEVIFESDTLRYVRELKYLAPFFTLPLVAVTTACKHKRKRERLDRRITYTFIYTYTLIIRPVLPEKKWRKNGGSGWKKRHAPRERQHDRKRKRRKNWKRRRMRESSFSPSFFSLSLSLLLLFFAPFILARPGRQPEY